MLSIRIYPDPILRVRCQEVEIFDDELRKLAADMVETMHAAPGVGLAASQVGDDRRLAVVDPSVGENRDDLLVLVNPIITAADGEDEEVEGCLSVPGISDKVKRAASITVKAQSLSAEPFELSVDGLVARVIQHEIDHLNGVLFVDHLRGLRKESARRQLRRLARKEEVHA
jgi:peptide deformylase